MRFKIWYDTGLTFTDQAGSAFDAPGLGVQIIVMEDDLHGRFQQSRFDYYVWDESTAWVGCDLFGLWDYLQRPGRKKVIFGRTIPNYHYDAIIQQAEQDEYIPHRTAWAMGEQR